MAKFYTTIKGLEGKDEAEMIRFAKGLRRAQVKLMANETQLVIRRIIRSRVVRPLSTGNLARWAGQVELLPQGEAGVGNIEDLNSNAPYWYWINFGVAQSGRRRPPASIGYFAPGSPAPSQSSFREGRFVHDSSSEGGFIMIPTKPIDPMNYIEATIATMNTRAQAILSKVTVRTIATLG